MAAPAAWGRGRVQTANERHRACGRVRGRRSVLLRPSPMNWSAGLSFAGRGASGEERKRSAARVRARTARNRTTMLQALIPAVFGLATLAIACEAVRSGRVMLRGMYFVRRDRPAAFRLVVTIYVVVGLLSLTGALDLRAIGEGARASPGVSADPAEARGLASAVADGSTAAFAEREHQGSGCLKSRNEQHSSARLMRTIPSRSSEGSPRSIRSGE